MSVMRLQRILARAGVASRRRAEELIREGRVKVNGRVAELGMSADPERDDIRIGRRRVRPGEARWLVLNKPLGTVVTRKDERGRPTVFQFVPRIPGLIYVGRLDVMTGGLLLMTTDGDGAHRLMHPRYEVERTYEVIVHGLPAALITPALERTVTIDGRPVCVTGLRVAELSDGASRLELVLKEGRNRIVRRLCKAVGLKVERLTRTRYGPVSLGRLEPGEWRYLTGSEVQNLMKLQTVPVRRESTERTHGPQR